MIVYCEDNKIRWKWNSKDFPFKYLATNNNEIPQDTLVGDYFSTSKGERGVEESIAEN